MAERTAVLSGLWSEQFHASRAEQAFSDSKQLAGSHFAERPVSLGRSGVDPQDELL